MVERLRGLPRLGSAGIPCRKEEDAGPTGPGVVHTHLNISSSDLRNLAALQPPPSFFHWKQSQLLPTLPSHPPILGLVQSVVESLLSTNLCLGVKWPLGHIILGLLAVSIIAAAPWVYKCLFSWLASFSFCCPPKRGLLLFHRHEARSYLPSASPAPGTQSELPASCPSASAGFFLPRPHKWLSFPSVLRVVAVRPSTISLSESHFSYTQIRCKYRASWQKREALMHTES